MDYAISTVLSWATMVRGIEYSITKNEDAVLSILKLAVCYFICDSIHILYKRNYENYMFIIHHVLAAYIGLCGYFGYININALDHYFVTFEFSNLFLNIWSLTNKNKQYPKLNYISFPLVICTYVPARTLILPIVTKDIFMDSWSRGYYGLCAVYTALLVMSFMYSRILLKIAAKKIHLYDLNLEKFWAMFTYVFKVYITLYHIIVHKFILFGIADIIHIIISWMYNISNYSTFYQRLDVVSIHSRMLATNILSWEYTRPNYYTYSWNLAIISWLIKNFKKIDLVKNRNFYALLYILNFLISVYNGLHLIDMYYFLYIYLAWFVWFFRFPECFIDTSFTSIALMHVLIILSDLKIYSLET